jgi:hypothetical protein
MAKITTAITDKQSKTKYFPGGETISKSANIPAVPETVAATVQSKNKFILLNAAGEIVATLIDRDMAETWVSSNKMGAIRFISSQEFRKYIK